MFFCFFFVDGEFVSPSNEDFVFSKQNPPFFFYRNSVFWIPLGGDYFGINQILSPCFNENYFRQKTRCLKKKVLDQKKQI